MVIAEVIGEVMGVIGERADQLRVGVPDQPQLVPEVFNALSQLVQVGDARLILHAAQSLPPAAVAAVKAGSDQVPAVALEGKRLDSRAAGLELGGRGGYRSFDGAVLMRDAVLSIELTPELVQPVASRRPEALGEPVECLDQDLGVPEAAQASGALAVMVVLETPGVVPDRRPNQPQRRADLFDVFPRLVDRLGGFRTRLAAQLGDGIVDPAANGPLDAGVHELARKQPVGAGIELPRAAVTQSLQPHPRCGGYGRTRDGEPGGLFA
jgi:hypothetical protein